ncbi:MAG: aminotransferase class V-fold PLP-dependent enzyme [Gemmatimonadota bacterium]
MEERKRSLEHSLDLDADTMRRLGYSVVDRIVDRITNLRQDAAWRGALRAQLEPPLLEPAPEDGNPEFDQLLDRLYARVLPFAARVDHPRFLAFVPGCPTWPSILGDWIATGHNIFQGTWLGSSGPSALELVVLEWFRQWLGLPETAGGLLMSGGSAANLTALVCARSARSADEQSRAVIYLGSESHSSVAKAARILGFPTDRVRILPVDADFRIPIPDLERAIARDRADGNAPLLIVANAGATSTGAIDPLPELAALAKRESMWLHVDGAYGGFAVLTDRGKRWLTGIEQADSVTLDPHKWLYQPFETGCLLVRDSANLVQAFHMMPDYLQDTAVAGQEVNFGDRGIQLTRSARAIKVWLSLQYFGLSRIRAAIDQTLDLTLDAEAMLRAAGCFEILTGAQLGVVCFRRTWPGASETVLEQRNLRLTRDLAQSGLALISSTRVQGRYALRFCIMNHRTTSVDIEQVVDWLATADVGD